MTPLKLTMLSREALNDNTVNMAFAVSSEQPFVVIAGQFLRLHFTQDDGLETFRSYSVASIFPEEKTTLDQIDIAVSWVPGGLATERLSQMQVGDQLEATGPYGRFCLLPDRHERYFLIATGTGVTPYRAMLNEIELRLQAGSEFYVVMGAQDATGLLYEADFVAMEQRYEGFHYVPCLSRQQRDKPGPNDQSGYVQQYLAQHEFDAENDITYLCGNPNMVDDAYQLLKDKGLPVPLIKREKYVSPPIRKK
ncbi:FAD-binding oxidoreductase [Marinicella meishanensis]|uniref:FAD-binding oxidoreductase n=1 Tax=Marinicella meishanensis TaxID=2873263 RepID=UPI001CBFE176|nr:FAD-binding oxidoreductase [Marinicella sp. NBU2979]